MAIVPINCATSSELVCISNTSVYPSIVHIVAISPVSGPRPDPRFYASHNPHAGIHLARDNVSRHVAV
eukprot:6183432-Pleurochrysis_carterae.AAC.2